MAPILIAVIYLAFISMGLPDAILGSTWPAMYPAMNVPVSYAGVVSFLIASGTVISSLMSDRMVRRFGCGGVTLGSTLLIVLALLAFSYANEFWHLCVAAIPCGLGAGAVDAALNNYVALNYKSRHMSWIHFFWGVGAAAGPYIMGLCLTGGYTWNMGYRIAFFAQLFMAVALFFTRPLWKKTKEERKEGAQELPSAGSALAMPGAKAIMISFFSYCALEAMTGMWASSFLVSERGLDATTAASWASLFYIGITIGRFLNGFITDRLGDRMMVRIGQVLAALGAGMLLIPGSKALSFVGLIAIGLGCAPIYPCLLHETPVNFGVERSQAMMGLQMACAYIGSTVMPPVLGWMAGRVSLGLYPFFLLGSVILLAVTSERMNSTTVQRRKKAEAE